MIEALALALTLTGAPVMPNTRLTPGDAFPTATREDVCRPGYAHSVRHVSGSTKHRVYAAYGIGTHHSGEYEVDHLISLELGGSNDERNLWPQSYETRPWNARVKDRLENYLHAQVCGGRMTLLHAQVAISTDWIGSYAQLLGEPRE